MSKGLTLEQMEFLVSKGMSAEEMLAFVKMGTARSKGAERVARYRARKKAETESVTNGVTCNVTSNALPPPIENIHTPPVSPNGENRAKRSKSIPAAKPADVSEQVWADWQDHRKRKGGTFSQTALDGIRREADKAGWKLEDALSKAMQRNWQGFEAGWVEARSAGPPGGADPLVSSFLARHATAPA